MSKEIVSGLDPTRSPDLILINSPLRDYGLREKDDYEVLPPMGLGYIASQAFSEDHNVGLIDAEYHGVSQSVLAKTVNNLQPRFAGINVLTPNRAQALKFAEQLDPYTPHLRGHEEVKKEDIITCYVHLNTDDPKEIKNIQIEMGKNIQNEPIAENLAEHTINNVFGLWWGKYDIPKWMAAATEIFPYGSYSIPVLEGQTRFPSKWCLFYGMKIDSAEKADQLNSLLDF